MLHRYFRAGRPVVVEIVSLELTNRSFEDFLELTAIMQVGHLGSCLTRELTGRYAFHVICRLVFEMATRYRGLDEQ